MGKVIKILTPYSYGSNFSKINDTAVKKHCKLKPSFQMRKPRNLDNEVESDPCPGGPNALVVKEAGANYARVHAVFIV